jgi:long-subunit acyl-CoA synthetase (AMP-forming)
VVPLKQNVDGAVKDVPTIEKVVVLRRTGTGPLQLGPKDVDYHALVSAQRAECEPEWVESELLARQAIAQAVVWGEGRADNVAVLVPRGPDIDDTQLAQAVADVNAGLPDYARVSRIVRASAPFSTKDGLLTANGRPRRDAILARYGDDIEASYGRAPLFSVPGVSA